MANKFVLSGAGCSLCAWVLVVLACGLPLFSATYLTVQDLGLEGDGHMLAGSGIWGTGVWYYGDFCENRTAVGEDCYTYEMWSSFGVNETACAKMADAPKCNPDWLKGGEAASVLTCLLILVALGVGMTGKTLIASLLTFISMILSIVPFAVWEGKYCGLDLSSSESALGNDCNRHVSYGFQVAAFLALLTGLSGFLIGNFKNDQ